MAAESSCPLGPFESVEKRLQMVFAIPNLRKKFARTELEEILRPVGCAIEDVLSGEDVDAYILSASSLFIFDDTLILKTCGRTKIFECIRKIIRVAEQPVISVLYTRGSFSWPESQPYPHQRFTDEEEILRERLPEFKRKAVVSKTLGNNDWHVFSASSSPVNREIVTVEICMRDLDREKASLFYKGKHSMTDASGLSSIFPEATVNAKEFEPCGYSMNAVEGTAVSTSHVAPEEEVSFASFETFHYNFKTGDMQLKDVVARVLGCFKPKRFSIAIHSTTNVHGNESKFELGLGGYGCEVKDVVQLGLGGSILLFTFRKLNQLL